MEVQTLGKRVTIKDVAHQAGVSVTTVAKALGGKPKIGSETRQTVLRIIDELGYTPNKNAMAMARTPIQIGIICQHAPTEFIRYMIDGFNTESAMLSDYRVGTHIRFFSNSTANHEVKEHLQEFIRTRPNGIILVPSKNPAEYNNELQQLKAMRIPVLCLIYRTDGLFTIGTVQLNAHMAGQIAAEFISLVSPKGAKVAVFTGFKDMDVHKYCAFGFEELATHRGMEVCGVFDTCDNREVGYDLTKRVLAEHPDLKGIYVSSYNSASICQCLEDVGLSGEIRIVGHDLSPELAEKIRKGSLTATLFQNQYEMGRRSVRYMYEYLVGMRKVEDCSMSVTPQLLLSSNLKGYSHYCGFFSEE